MLEDKNIKFEIFNIQVTLYSLFFCYFFIQVVFSRVIL